MLDSSPGGNGSPSVFQRFGRVQREREKLGVQDRSRTPNPLLFVVEGTAAVADADGDWDGGAIAHGAAHLALDLGHHLGMLIEILLGILAALPQAGLAVSEPGAGLADEAVVHAQIEHAAALGDALAEHDVELRLLERRRHLVLRDLDPGAAADHFRALLELLDTPDFEADRGPELQRAAAGSGFRVAVHHPDLLADLVDEDTEA